MPPRVALVGVLTRRGLFYAYRRRKNNPIRPPVRTAYSQAEVQALRDKFEELADDVQALSALAHTLRAALVSAGLIKGAA